MTEWKISAVSFLNIYSDYVNNFGFDITYYRSSIKNVDYHNFVISDMISNWSVINVAIVIFVGICQVYVLRNLFNSKRPSTRTTARA